MTSRGARHPGASREPLVLTVRDAMDKSTLESVVSACQRARARLSLYEPGGDLDEPPAVVLAQLPAGARRLPEVVVDLADHRYPGTPVLLLCDEPLVRPTVTLQRGRVTLVEPPTTMQRTLSRLRLLLDQHAPSRRYHCQELRQDAFWAAELLSGDPAPARPYLVTDERGLTAVLAPSPLDGARINAALSLAAQHTDGVESVELAELLGPRTGLVHLSTLLQAWFIHWPESEQPLWFFSALRLPRWSDLALRGAKLAAWQPAEAGDVVAALSSRSLLSGSPSSVPPTELFSALLDGGPAVLDLVEERLCTAPQPLGCFIAEVR